jgi:hypothetical protein
MGATVRQPRIAKIPYKYLFIRSPYRVEGVGRREVLPKNARDAASQPRRDVVIYEVLNLDSLRLR